MVQNEQTLDELENELRKKGYHIEKVETKEGEAPLQCDSDDCFGDAEVFIEGSFCCLKHRVVVLKKLKESDKEIKQEKEKSGKEMQERLEGGKKFKL